MPARPKQVDAAPCEATMPLGDFADGAGRSANCSIHQGGSGMPEGKIRTAMLGKTALIGLPLLLLAAAPAAAQQPSAADPTKTMRPVTDAMLLNPDPGEWLMWRRTYDGYGYSPLDQITRDNVKDLQVAWTWSLNNGATESTPIVHDGVLYIWNYADKVQALNG